MMLNISDTLVKHFSHTKFINFLALKIWLIYVLNFTEKKNTDGLVEIYSFQRQTHHISHFSLLFLSFLHAIFSSLFFPFIFNKKIFVPF